MSRHLPNATVREIGAQRIDRLLTLSEQAVRDGREDRARRYVGIARAISAKTRVKMPKERMFCRRCNAPLMPGISCTVRLSNHKVTTTCNMCGEVRRHPYTREQRT
jgi:ribonuclease P protein subunit RPR2